MNRVPSLALCVVWSRAFFLFRSKPERTHKRQPAVAPPATGARSRPPERTLTLKTKTKTQTKTKTTKKKIYSLPSLPRRCRRE